MNAFERAASLLPLLDALTAVEVAKARAADRRRAERLQIGWCPCGLALGDQHCPICDGILGPLGRCLREDGMGLAEIVQAERDIIDGAARLTAAGNAISPRALAAMALEMRLRTRDAALTEGLRAELAPLAGPSVDGKLRAAPRPPNRLERRRARSRRWHGPPR